MANTRNSYMAILNGGSSICSLGTDELTNHARRGQAQDADTSLL